MSAPMVGMGMDCPPLQGGLEPPLFLPVFAMGAFVFRAQWRPKWRDVNVRRRDAHSGDSLRRG